LIGRLFKDKVELIVDRENRVTAEGIRTAPETRTEFIPKEQVTLEFLMAVDFTGIFMMS
jgi:hypothetical protein